MTAASAAVHADRQETFAEAPHRRGEQVREARERARRNKGRARAWAERRGMKMRHEEASKTFELIDLHRGRPLYLVTQNDNAAISSAADRVRNTAPFFVDGSGVTVGIWDGGTVKTNHQELAGRVRVGDDADSISYHASHVAGTIGASGIVVRAGGMAPSVLIDSYDWNFNDAEMSEAAASYAGEAGKIYLSNHSYGILAGWFYASWLNPWSRRSGFHWWGDLGDDSEDEFFGQYGSGPREWDSIVYGAPYFLPVKAAGNERDDGPAAGARVYYTPDNGDTWLNTIYNPDTHPLGDGVYKNGYDTIPYYGNAKNILTVGAVSDAVLDGERNPAAASSLDFTSWGPADDGRIKPDVVANGDALYSCNSSTVTSYATRSGTSMSCPNASGSAALLVDFYGRLYPGQAMRASTLKGLMIHTADDLGRPGPDYEYGWGLINTRKAAELLRRHALGNTIGLTEARLMDTGVREHTYTAFSHGGAGNPVRVTLCWTDPPGTATSENDSRTPVLMNDLNLKVKGPNGRTTYYPFLLSYKNPEALATTKKKNSIDNVEQVLIHAPRRGIYTITVSVDDAMTNGEQWYSLITDGIETDADANGFPDAWEADFFLDMTGSVVNEDADADGIDNLSEFIAGTDPTDPGSVFAITAAEPQVEAEGAPFVIRWDSVPGRIYNVSWTYHPVYIPYTDISGDLYWPVNSYTDHVDRAGNAAFYRVNVRMSE